LNLTAHLNEVPRWWTRNRYFYSHIRPHHTKLT